MAPTTLPSGLIRLMACLALKRPMRCWIRLGKRILISLLLLFGSCVLPHASTLFLWKVAHHRLMTNYERLNRGLTDSALYPRCNLHPESILHVFTWLWGCFRDMAKSGWSQPVAPVCLSQLGQMAGVQFKAKFYGGSESELVHPLLFHAAHVMGG